MWRDTHLCHPSSSSSLLLPPLVIRHGNTFPFPSILHPSILYLSPQYKIVQPHLPCQCVCPTCLLFDPVNYRNTNKVDEKHVFNYHEYQCLGNSSTTDRSQTSLQGWKKEIIWTFWVQLLKFAVYREVLFGVCFFFLICKIIHSL